MQNNTLKSGYIAKILGLLAIVLVVVAIVQYQGKAKTEWVTIGGLFHLTGFASFAGESSRDGFIMALEDSGVPVKTVIEDAGSSLKQSVSGATKLTEIDKAVAVIGPEWTEFGEVVAPIATRAQVPFISPWVVAEAPFVKPPYYWSGFPSDRAEHVALAEHFSTHGLEKIALVSSNNFWSKTNIKMFKEEISKKQNLQIISEVEVSQDTKDFRTVVAKIKKEKPDIIFSAIADDAGHGAFVSQVRQMGMTVPVASHSARANSPVMKDRYASVLHDQMFAEIAPSERKEEFAKKYEARFGKKVGAPSAEVAYDMMTVLLRAVKSGARTSEDIISYLHEMAPYEGYSGQIAFDEQGRLPIRKAVVKMYNASGVAVEAR